MYDCANGICIVVKGEKKINLHFKWQCQSNGIWVSTFDTIYTTQRIYPICRCVDGRMSFVHTSLFVAKTYTIFLLFNAIHVHYAFDSDAYENLHYKSETATQFYSCWARTLAQHYLHGCVYKWAIGLKETNARVVIVMRWPHGMQVPKATRICSKCVCCACVCLFACMSLIQHFGSLTFKLHTHFPLNI